MPPQRRAAQHMTQSICVRLFWRMGSQKPEQLPSSSRAAPCACPCLAPWQADAAEKAAQLAALAQELQEAQAEAADQRRAAEEAVAGMKAGQVRAGAGRWLLLLVPLALPWLAAQASSSSPGQAPGRPVLYSHLPLLTPAASAAALPACRRPPSTAARRRGRSRWRSCAALWPT